MKMRIPGRSFVVYYGRGPLPGIDSYDIAILEPDGWTTPMHRQLKAAHVTTLAYLSAFEVPPWRFEQTGLVSGDLVHVGGQRWVKEPFGNWLARPDSPRWREYLERRVEFLYRQGWDGLFVDTLGDVEDEQLADQAGWLVPAMADLVRHLRARFPARPLVVNNGLFQLVPFIAPYIDGVCWEGDLTPETLRQPWAQAVLEYLGRAHQEQGWVNLMLTHIAGSTASVAPRLRRFSADADRYGFLSYAAPTDYADGIRLRDGRVVSPVP